MTHKQWGYTFAIMLILAAVFGELSRYILQFIPYSGITFKYTPSQVDCYIFIAELISIWLLWLAIIPVMRWSFRR